MKRRKVFNRNTVVVRGNQVWCYEVRPDKFIYCGRYAETTANYGTALDRFEASWEWWYMSWDSWAQENDYDFVLAKEPFTWRRRGRIAVFDYGEEPAFWTKARYYRTEAGCFLQHFDAFFTRGHV